MRNIALKHRIKYIKFVRLNKTKQYKHNNTFSVKWKQKLIINIRHTKTEHPSIILSSCFSFISIFGNINFILCKEFNYTCNKYFLIFSYFYFNTKWKNKWPTPFIYISRALIKNTKEKSIIEDRFLQKISIKKTTVYICIYCKRS